MASRKNEIKTNIEANSEGFIKAMDEVKRSISSTRTEFANINAIMKSTGETTDQLRGHKKQLQTEIDNTKSRLDTLNKGLEESIKVNGEESEATRIAREEVQKASTHYENLKQKLKEVNDKLDDQTFSLKSVSSGFEKVSDATGKFASKIKWVSAGAGSLLGLSAKTAIEFEDAFVGVKKTVEGTDEELEQIRKEIMALSNRIPLATTELFALAEEAGQLGIKTADITNFTETMAKLGTATNLSATEAGQAIATFVNVMGTLPENYERIGSVIVELGNNSKATEADIVSMAQRMSGAGATLGMSESSILGLATALSSVGLEAEMGGTAISRVMNDFNRAANGVETKYGSLKQYAEICGMSTKEFANVIKNDAGEAVKQFVIGLGDTNRTGKSTIQLMSDLGINEVRLTDTMLRLANASGTVEEYMNMANAEWEINNALTEEASKRYADTKSQIEIAKNKISELADKFGQLLLPTINDLLGKAGKLVDWFGGLEQGTQKTILKTLAFTTALAPLSKGISILTKDISGIFNAINKLKNNEKLITGITKTFKGLGSVVKTAGTSIISILGKIGGVIMAHPVIAIITAVIAGIVLLWTKCEWFRNLVTGMFEKIKEVCVSAFNGIKTVVGNVWNKVVEITKPIFETIGSIITKVCDKVKTVWEPIKKFFSSTWNYIVSSLKPVAESLFNMFNEAWLLIKTIWDLVLPFFQGIWEGIKAVFSVVAEVIGGYFSFAWESIKFIWDLVQPYFQAIWTGIQTVFSVVSTILGGFFSSAWTAIKGVWDIAVQYFKLVWTGISAVFSVVKTVIGGAFQVAWEVIKAVWDTVTGYFKAIFDTIAGIFSVIRNVLTGNFSDAWEGIKGIVGTWKEWFQGIWDSIASVFGKVKDFFKNTFSSAWNAIKSVFSGVGSFFSGIWSTIKSVFTNIAQKVGETMSSVFKSAVNGLLSTAEKILNVPINAINKAIDILNKVPGVSIGKVSTFKLPRMETGGVLDKGARTIIAGENGAEAIVPLEKNTGWINKVAEQFKHSFVDTMGINTDYLGQNDGYMYSEEYLADTVDLLERILAKPSHTYLDGRRISEATASTDDVASGDLLEKLERGLVV